MAKYKVGDEVWIPSCDWTPEVEDCPACEGTGHLEVRPRGSQKPHTIVRCEYCNRELMGVYSPGPGKIRETYSYVARAIKIRIEGVREETERPIEYKYNVHGNLSGSHSCSTVKESDVCLDESEAQAVSEQLKATYEEEDLRKHVAQDTRCYSKVGWSLGYHRRRIDSARREAEFHRKWLEIPVEEFEKLFEVPAVPRKKRAKSKA